MDSIKEKARDLFGAASETGTGIACEVFISGVAGTFIPGVMDGVLAYKQRRQERMYVLFMEELKKDIQEIDANLRRLNRTTLLDFKDKYFGMVSDYVMEEVQEEKIKYLENGLVVLSGMEHTNENFVLSYYDTFKELRILDIAFLKNYFSRRTSNGLDFMEFCNQFELTLEQYYSIRDKLERMGLLVSRRRKKEDNLYENLKNIQIYLIHLDQGKRSTLKNFKDIGENDFYEISKYGMEFLRFFTRT